MMPVLAAAGGLLVYSAVRYFMGKYTLTANYGFALYAASSAVFGFIVYRNINQPPIFTLLSIMSAIAAMFLLNRFTDETERDYYRFKPPHPIFKKLKLSGRTRRNWLYAYIFLLPWLIGIFALVIVPLFNSASFSFNTVRLTPRGMVFQNVGWQNYHNLFVLDTSFVQNLIGFVVQTFIQTPVIVSFALIIAILLNMRVVGRGLFRSVFFLPVIIATGPVMNELVAQGAATVPTVNLAAIYNAISFMPYWVVDPIVTLFGRLIMILWNSGVQILIFLAALQKVSPELYEAAKIDGGSAWECFWKITAPTIKPMVFLNSIYTVIWLATSNQNVMINLIYDSMYASNRGYGYASAQAWTYSAVILLLLSICWLLFREKRDKKYKEVKRLPKRNW
jgi:ABC-type sugar transport system permease subunit